MATDEDNHKNEARDDWTGCTFRVERGPSSEGRAWGMAEVLTKAKVRAAFAAGASGKKKLNKGEQQDFDSAADTSAQRVLDELDANQDANDGDDDGEEQVRARVANFMRIASMA